MGYEHAPKTTKHFCNKIIGLKAEHGEEVT